MMRVQLEPAAYQSIYWRKNGESRFNKSIVDYHEYIMSNICAVSIYLLDINAKSGYMIYHCIFMPWARYKKLCNENTKN